MEQDKRCLNFHIRINYFSFFTKLLDCSRGGSINSLNVSSSPDFWQWLENRSLSIIYFSKLNFLISRQQVKKYRVSFFPPPPLFPWPKSAHTLFKLPFPRAFHFRNHHSQMDCPPARFAPFPPPPKIFFSLVQHKLSRNYDSFVPSTMLIGMRVHARAAGPQRWSAHISTRRLQNGAYTRRWRLHCLARVCARYAIILCRWWVAHASPHPR